MSQSHGKKRQRRQVRTALLQLENHLERVQCEVLMRDRDYLPKAMLALVERVNLSRHSAMPQA